jgi:ABC-type transporter Mla MlaB component
MAGLAQVDHTCAEVLADWIQRKRKGGTQLELSGLSDSDDSGHYRRLAEAAKA